jgi:hypothetical protein
METIFSNFISEWIETSTGRQGRRGLTPFGWQAVGYLLALTVAEAVTTLADARLGMALHGIVLLALIAHAAFSLGRLQGGFLIALAFGSLIRLLSLATPLPYFPQVYWYAVIGAPLLIAAFLASRSARLGRGMLGLTVRRLPEQAAVAVSGVGLGLIEYLILRPQPLVERFEWGQVWLPALILLVFTGFLEELIFRGLMQYTAVRGLGRFGMLYVAAVFAVLHLGYRSLADVLFVFGVALYFGWVAARTGSILGATLAHGLTNITLFLVFPFAAAWLSGFPGPAVVTPAPTAGYAELAPTPVTGQGLAPTDLAPTPSPAVSAGLAPTLALTDRVGGAGLAPIPSPTAGAGLAPTLAPTDSPGRAGPAPTAQPTAQPTAAPTPTPGQAVPQVYATAPAELFRLVDDGGPGFSTTGGPWSSAGEGLYGDLLWAPAGVSGAAAEWRFPYSTCGRFEVEVYLPAFPAASGSALYQVGHRYGMASRLVDQSAYPGKWVSLGAWEFLPGAGAFLRLTTATGEDPVLGQRVLFDAARWTYVEACGE